MHVCVFLCLCPLTLTAKYSPLIFRIWGSLPTGALVPGSALSPPQHTHPYTHTHTCTLSHMCTLNNLVARVCAQALTHSWTWWSTLHINKDKSRNGQRKAPRGTKLLQGDHSRVAVCSCVCRHVCVYAGPVTGQESCKTICQLTAANRRLPLEMWGVGLLADFLSKPLPPAAKV